ncbi:MAG: histidine phosphatase family protein [Roseburia sp.]|nr:histidine phosphatase family protein [Roseburia sp.]
MKFYLIRHGMTKGNGEKRYVGGRTDEDLTQAGIEELKRRNCPDVERVYASPMKRCVHTAEILYPRQEIFVKKEFRETDFGRFENKNYQELKEEKAYQDWLKTGGTRAFPEGESKEEVRSRVLGGFRQVFCEMQSQNLQTAALVVHGGTIMYLMEAYGGEEKGFYDYQIENGGCICLSVKCTLKK